MNRRTLQAAKILLWVGIAHGPLLAFHVAFPWLFQWSTELDRLSSDNAGLLLCFHVCGMFWLGSMGAVSLIDALRLRRGEPPHMPRGFWLWMAAFYLFRAAAEFPCFGFSVGGLAVMVLVLVLSLPYLRVWSLLAPSLPDAVPDQRFDV